MEDAPVEDHSEEYQSLLQRQEQNWVSGEDEHVAISEHEVAPIMMLTPHPDDPDHHNAADNTNDHNSIISVSEEHRANSTDNTLDVTPHVLMNEHVLVGNTTPQGSPRRASRVLPDAPVSALAFARTPLGQHITQAKDMLRDLRTKISLEQVSSEIDALVDEEEEGLFNHH